MKLERRIHFWLIVLAILGGLLFYAIGSENAGHDWRRYYLPAIEDWSNRYDYEVYNPPWLIWFLKPLSWLGQRPGFALLSAFNVWIVGWSIAVMSQDHKIGRMLFGIFHYATIYLLILGQVDGIALGGMVIATLASSWPQSAIGSILAMVKPQAFIGGLLISFWKSERKIPFFLAGLIFGLFTIAIWGLWFTQQEIIDTSVPWNRAFPIFPLGWVIGLPLLGYGLHRKDETYGLIAMPFLVPYFGPHSFIGMLAFLLAKVPFRWCFAVWLGITAWMVITNVPSL